MARTIQMRIDFLALCGSTLFHWEALHRHYYCMEVQAMMNAYMTL